MPRLSNTIELMPAMPFTVALMAGIILCFYWGIIPMWIIIALLGASFCNMLILRSKRRWRTFSLLFVAFFLGMMVTQIKKEHENIGTFGQRQEIARREESSAFEKKAQLLRNKLSAEIRTEITDPKQVAIISAVSLGEKRMIDRQTRNNFSITGTSHILALSGLHLSILFVLLSSIFVHQPFQILGKTLVMLAVWAYVVMVGMPASLMRAATMLTIYSVFTADGRSKMSFNALFATALVMLLANPFQLWDLGFQLSFMSVLSIFIFSTPINKIIPIVWQFEHPVFRFFWSMTSVSCAAQIGTAPLVAYYFGRFSSLFILTNLVAIPLVSILLYSVCLAQFFSLVPFLKAVFLFLTDKSSHYLISFIDSASRWPFISIENIALSWPQVIIIYLTIAVSAILLSLLTRRF